MKKIYVIDGPIAGMSFDLKGDLTTIGRSSENDIIISDIGVSREHAKFMKKHGRIFVVDLSSLHGVFVDGNKIARGRETEVNKGSVIRVGNTVLSFQKKAEKDKGAQRLPSLPPERHHDKTSELSLEMRTSRDYTRSLELLLKVANIFSQSLNTDELLSEVVDQIFILLERIDRGAILLLNKDKGTLQEVASKTRMEDKAGLFSTINYSRTIVNRAITEAKPVMLSDTSRLNPESLSNPVRARRTGGPILSIAGS